MKRWILFTLCLFGLILAVACNLQRCSEGADCAISNGAGPSAIPSPTVAASPTPSPKPGATPSPTPESCRIDFMVLQPRDGFTLAKDESAHLSLTPYQQVTGPDGSIGQRETSPACDLPRESSIIWTSSPPVLNIGTGFEPTVTRVGVGVAQVTATLEGKVSNAVVVR